MRFVERKSGLQPPADVPRAGLGPLVRGWTRYVLASAALLLPCFWQARIQAGDLGSHIYNAWLAELIRQGRAPGLSIVPQTTNVLFDLLLSALYRGVGSAAAQRIAVSLAVLVFVWGAFAFIATTARRAWALVPALAVLAYGWVFHMGFFNFYLSLGLCFWALALAWNHAPRRLLAAAPILAVAYAAHALPVAWACAVLGFLWLARRMSAGRLMVTAVMALCVVHIAMTQTMPTAWGFWQIECASGADQAWVYDRKYLAVAVVLLLEYVALVTESIRRNGARRWFGSETFQVLAVTAGGIFLLPTTVWIPGYQRALLFIAERMSLTAGVLVLAAVATGSSRRWHGWATGLLAAVFFLFLYGDERALNGFEDRMNEAVARLPPMARVVSNAQADLRANALSHIVDRACIGRCYSYANYEPPSGQFRIRVTGPTSIVEPTGPLALHMERGDSAVLDRDLPLYRISVAADGSLAVDSMAAGAQVGASQWRGLSWFP